MVVTHKQHFLKAHGLPVDSSYSLTQLAKISGIQHSTLKEVEKRGYGAYNNNYSSVREKGSFKKGTNAAPRFKLSPQQWSRARVYSFIDGSKKHDLDLR
jgi:hypothetical protein